MKNILILGATSAIAEKLAQSFAVNGDKLYLVARNEVRLKTIADDLQVKGCKEVYIQAQDLVDTKQHASLIKLADKKLGGLDIVLVAYGTLSDQKKCETSFEKTLEELNTNCISVISILTHTANLLESKRSGTIVVISSVAGDRGRQSNYIYGTAKGALSIFMQGLRNRLSRHGVHVLTIKPGFVDTPMTKEFTKGLLWVSPDVIAKGIMRAITKRKDVVYLPFFWRYIMLIICSIPENIFKKLSL